MPHLSRRPAGHGEDAVGLPDVPPVPFAESRPIRSRRHDPRAQLAAHGCAAPSAGVGACGSFAMTRVALAAGLAMIIGLAHAAEPMKLPYEMPNKHMGVSTCSSSVCHGSVKSKDAYNVQLNEYITWAHQDTHSKAYSVLLNERSRAMAAKLGIADASKAKICLDCHTDNVPENMRGREFNITDGVGCEAWHGVGVKWLETQTKDAK